MQSSSSNGPTGLVVIALAASLLFACASKSTPDVSTTDSPSAGGSPTPSSSPSGSQFHVTDLPVPAGTTVLSTVTGKGSTTLGPLSSGGTLAFQIACVGPNVAIKRAPDVSFTVTCNGYPYGVQVEKVAQNANPLEITADNGEWMINVGVAR